MRTCRTCGREVDVDGRFCNHCGSTLDPTTGAPKAASDPPPAPASAPDAPTDPEPQVISANTPFVPSDQAAAPNRRSKTVRRVAIAAAGVLVIAAITVIAVQAISGSDAGAAEPDEAVDTMIQSIVDENPVDMVNSLAPSELAFFGDVEDATEETVDGEGSVGTSLEERGITLDAEDLIPGLSVQVDNLEYEVEELAPDVAKVTITSLDGSWTFDPRQMLDAFDVEKMTEGRIDEEEALGEIEERDIEGGEFDIDELDLGDLDPFVMAIEEDGGWFVSPLYTVLQYVAEANDLEDEVDFSDPPANGAETPEEAIEQTIETYYDALLTGDVGAVIDTLPPTRYRAFYAYRNVLAELTDGFEEFEGDVDIEVEVNAVSRFDDPRGEGVTLEDATLTISDPDSDNQARFTIEGNCIEMIERREFDDEEQRDEFCLDDEVGPFQNGIPGIDRFFLVLQEEDGRFYVDPLATIGSYLASLDFDALADDLDDLLEGTEIGDEDLDIDLDTDTTLVVPGDTAGDDDDASDTTAAPPEDGTEG